MMDLIQLLDFRIVRDTREMPYGDWLHRLISFCLEHGRLRGDLIFAYNISPVALTYHRRNVLRRQCSEAFEDKISSCAITIFVCAGGKQPFL